MRTRQVVLAACLLSIAVVSAREPLPPPGLEFRLRQLPMTRLRELPAQDVAERVERWVGAISEGLVREIFPLTPREIIEALDLRRPIYRATASYGHFGRDEPGFTWERTDRAELLRTRAGAARAVPAAKG